MKCRKIIKIFIYYGYTTQFLYLAALISALVHIFMDDNIDPLAWKLPLPKVILFDSQTILGWLLTWFFQLNEGIAYFICVIITTTHFICCCVYIMAMCNHLNLIIDSVKFDSMQIRMEDNTQQYQQLWQRATENLQRAIKLHVNIYE